MSKLTIGEQVILLEKRVRESGFTTYMDWDEGLTDYGVHQFCKKYGVEHRFVEVIDGITMGVFVTTGGKDIVTREEWGKMI